MSDVGFIKVHRSLLGHPAFRNDSEAMAFAWLVARASWKPTRVRYKGAAITLERGQLSISVRDFAAAMDRPKGWVERLFARLKSETMVKTSSETGPLVITICNYDKFQYQSERGETLPETPDETATGQRQDTEQVREEVKKEGSDASASQRAAPEPVIQAFEDYNEVAADAGWPMLVKRTGARQSAMRSRLREDGLDGWRDALTRARASPFLGSDPPPPFVSFDWIAKPANFAKIIEGNYDHDRKPAVRPLNPNSTVAAILRAEAAAEREDLGDYPEAWLAIPAKFSGSA